MTKLTVKDLFACKGKRQLTEVYVRTAKEASACDLAGIDMIITSERSNGAEFRAAAPNTFFTIGLVYGDYTSESEVLRGGFKALRNGADAVYCGSSLKFVEALANEGIPVVGHVGFVPYKSTWFGGFKAVGKSAVDALKVYQKTVDYQNAGAIGVEIEIVPYKVATEISKRVEILLIGMGSGTGCDAQYLFSTDILGDNEGHIPRHAKVYRDFKSEYQRLHQESIAAFREFKQDVDSGTYPAANQLIEIKDEEFEKFMQGIS
ncbi:MAG: 3-methyl-2-oxobutanoate hydroxymethyltransferase [Caldilineaceae bacterium]